MNKATPVVESEPIEVKSYGVLLFLSLIWGTSFILIKKGLVVYAPEQLAALRIVISAVSFIPFLFFYWRKIDWSKWPYLIIVGLCGSGIPAFLFAIAQTRVSSSVAGILNSLTPLFTLVLGILIFGSTLVWSKVVGVLIGLAGAILLILFGSEEGIGGDLAYVLLIVLAGICYATSVNTVGAYLKDMDSIIISAVSFGVIGIPAGIYLLFSNFTTVFMEAEGAWEAFGYITILALGSTVLASIIFFKLVQWTSPVFASTVAYLIPIVALLWGVWDGEKISVFHILGMGLILTGVYLSRQKSPKPKH